MDTPCPIMYIKFPTGELKLEGTFVYPKNRYLRLNLGKVVTAEEVFDVLLVFSRAYWIGSREDNPLENPQPVPEGNDLVVVSSDDDVTKVPTRKRSASKKPVIVESDGDLSDVLTGEEDILSDDMGDVAIESESDGESPVDMIPSQDEDEEVSTIVESSDEDEVIPSRSKTPPKKPARRSTKKTTIVESSDEDEVIPSRSKTPPKKPARRSTKKTTIVESSDEDEVIPSRSKTPPKKPARRSTKKTTIVESSDEDEVIPSRSKTPPKKPARRSTKKTTIVESSDEDEVIPSRSKTPPKKPARRSTKKTTIVESSDEDEVIPSRSKTPPKKPARKGAKSVDVDLTISSSDDDSNSGVSGSTLSLIEKIKNRAENKRGTKTYRQPKLPFGTVQNDDDSD
ncbi:hypothetical protein GEMRC1_000277 [Eukaryota sp. GEM-RC1]